ncbi:hypothetical protein L1049_015869 [Liquidambar formosana]|uniref:Uncharacterized protein n=1 Tax=Liquidambar formosana TaxID=63359 RepID=A0AAP0RYL5_LIQFO
MYWNLLIYQGIIFHARFRPACLICLFLSVLNLSHNNLSGEIPRGAQLETFENSSYMGNPHLCGPRLTNNCSGDELSNDGPHRCSYQDGYHMKEGGGNGVEIPSFYMSMGLGFMTGFWGFWTSLLFIPSWRHAYYRFLGNMYDKIYVMVAVNMTKVQRKFQSHQVSGVKN